MQLRSTRWITCSNLLDSFQTECVEKFGFMQPFLSHRLLHRSYQLVAIDSEANARARIPRCSFQCVPSTRALFISELSIASSEIYFSAFQMVLSDPLHSQQTRETRFTSGATDEFNKRYCGTSIFGLVTTFYTPCLHHYGRCLWKIMSLGDNRL